MSESKGLQMVFVAREDSSMPNKQNTHTFEDLASHFTSRVPLHDPVASQQIVGDVTCEEKPEVDYHRECSCVCDVPMGCHGPGGANGNVGNIGKNGKQGARGHLGSPGELGRPGKKGEVGEMGGCGMPGHEGAKGEPGNDGIIGLSGKAGELGIKGRVTFL